MSARIDVRYGRSPFRPTVWPGTPIPVPLLSPVDHVEVVDDWILWPMQDPKKKPTVELPPDFYLRELTDLDCDNLDAIADLVRRYGYFCAFQLEDLDDAAKYTHKRILVEAPENGKFINGHHRDNIILHLQTAQRAIEIWTASQAEGGLEELTEELVTEDALYQIQTDLPEHETLADIQDIYIQDLRDDLIATLNAALGKFSVGIGDLASRQPTIYSVSFLQMYNHITEGAVLLRCANEPCGNLFVRQRGRATFGQHRTSGVRYCSNSCARAQGQRELRRRRRRSSS